MTKDTYEVHAIKNARLSRRSPENFIGGDEHDSEMPLNYYVWVISNGARSIVVDTGFGEEMANKRGRQIVRPVAEGVKDLGIAPGSVKDVIITHMHYDHASRGDGGRKAARRNFPHRAACFKHMIWFRNRSNLTFGRFDEGFSLG